MHRSVGRNGDYKTRGNVEARSLTGSQASGLSRLVWRRGVRFNEWIGSFFYERRRLHVSESGMGGELLALWRNSGWKEVCLTSKLGV